MWTQEGLDESKKLKPPKRKDFTIPQAVAVGTDICRELKINYPDKPWGFINEEMNRFKDFIKKQNPDYNTREVLDAVLRMIKPI